MSFMDDLNTAERAILVSLPYRAGLMVSQSDTSGGEESDAQELQTLSNILSAYAGEVFVSETVQHIISETIKQKDRWPNWQKEIGDVEGDCRTAIAILSDLVEDKELNAFKQHLMEIAEAVALAFREIGDMSPVKRLMLRLSYEIKKARAGRYNMHYKSFDEFLNVSPAERKALEGLAKALDIRYTA